MPGNMTDPIHRTSKVRAAKHPGVTRSFTKTHTGSLPLVLWQDSVRGTCHSDGDTESWEDELGWTSSETLERSALLTA